MKYLGLDIGTKMVGVAVSDDGGTIAFPLTQLPRRTCVKGVLDLVCEREIEVVVLGESFNSDGVENAVMKDVRSVAEALSKSVTVVFEPEQFSTQAAERLGKGSDAEAATIILQSYLDRFRSEEEVVLFD